MGPRLRPLRRPVGLRARRRVRRDVAGLAPGPAAALRGQPHGLAPRAAADGLPRHALHARRRGLWRQRALLLPALRRRARRVALSRGRDGAEPAPRRVRPALQRLGLLPAGGLGQGRLPRRGDALRAVRGRREGPGRRIGVVPRVDAADLPQSLPRVQVGADAAVLAGPVLLRRDLPRGARGRRDASPGVRRRARGALFAAALPGPRDDGARAHARRHLPRHVGPGGPGLRDGAARVRLGLLRRAPGPRPPAARGARRP